MQTPTTSSSTTRKTSYIYSTIYPLISILLDSLKIIFLNHPKQFLSIYILTTLPLSIILTSLSYYSSPLKVQVAHLHWLAQVVPIRIESDNVRAEARTLGRKLLRIKAFHACPILILSLLTLISNVASTARALRGPHRLTIRAVFVTVKVTWTRPMLTSVVNYAMQLGWALLVDVIAAAVGYPTSVAVVAVGAAAEVYVTAVLSVALVVSVIEDRAGVDAVRAGSGLMRGRRACGWVLSGLVLVGSGCVGREMKGVIMEGGDLKGIEEWTVGMRVGYVMGLVGLLGWVIMWSYVVITVLYFDCKRLNNNYYIINKDDYNLIMINEVELDDNNDNDS